MKLWHKKCIVLLLFIIGLVLINRLLTFALVPYVSYSRQVIHDGIKDDNVYDLVSVGSSEELYSFNPFIADKMLGVNSYNMGTSGTMLNGGEYATFQAVLKHQSPKRIIITIGRYTMCEGAESPTCYTAIQPYVNDVGISLEYFFREAFQGGELGRLFPWSVNNVDTFEEAVNNIKVKSGKAFREFDSSVLPSDSLVYGGKGFCYQLKGEDNFVKYSQFSWDECIDPATGEFYHEKAEFNKLQVDILEKMIKECHDRNIDVIISIAPMTRYEMVARRYYDDYMTQLRDICTRNGAAFVDLNYARAELYDPEPYEYVDHAHVLDDGADRYTTSLCNWINMYDSGEDTSELFYQSWDEFIDSVDWDYYMSLE